MKAVLLAAGPGTRMRPLTHDRPKNLINVAGRPLLHHLLEALAEQGVKDIVVVVGHGDTEVQRYVGDGDKFGVQVEYARQDQSLGLGHALQTAIPMAGDGPVLVLAADAWYHPDLLRRLVDADAPAIMQLPIGSTTRYGVPHVEGGKATGIRLVDQGVDDAPAGGAWLVDRAFLDALTPDDTRMVEALDRSMRASPWTLVPAEAHETVDLVGAPELLRLHERLLGGLEPKAPELPEGVFAHGAVEVGEGTLLRPGTVIMGPVTIGKNCDIGPNAVIGPGTSVRNHTRIGPFTFTERCAIASNVTIGAQCRIQNAFVDNGATLGHGSRIDGGDGALVGQDARLGDESHVGPGGRIGVAANVSADRTVTDVPDRGMAV